MPHRGRNGAQEPFAGLAFEAGFILRELRQRLLDLAPGMAERACHLAQDLVFHRLQAGGARGAFDGDAAGQSERHWRRYSAASRSGRKPPDWRFQSCA